jgi:predicted nucleotidyltransferase
MNNLTEKEKQAVKELIDELKKLYGDNLSRVILYGSKARGDATEDSDIDILVVLKKKIQNFSSERKKVKEISWRLSYKYDLLLSIIIRSEQEYMRKDTPLLMNIEKEGIVL